VISGDATSFVISPFHFDAPPDAAYIRRHEEAISSPPVRDYVTPLFNLFHRRAATR